MKEKIWSGPSSRSPEILGGDRLSIGVWVSSKNEGLFLEILRSRLLLLNHPQTEVVYCGMVNDAKREHNLDPCEMRQRI
jgi:hypothetical protein